jgi:hypothetical protein
MKTHINDHKVKVDPISMRGTMKLDIKLNAISATEINRYFERIRIGENAPPYKISDY